MTSPALFDLTTFLETEREQVDLALERAMAALTDDLPPDLVDPVRHSVMTGGKRLRPILCATAFRTCGGARGPAAYDLCAAVELIHAYSLMHDDLPCMDDAELRRGRPTPHMVFGEVVAMRAGAVLIPAAGLQVVRGCRALGCDAATTARVLAELMAAAGAGGMVGGQVLDLVGEERVLSAQELDELHRRKTGALLTASLRIGGIAAGAGEPELASLDRYGRAIGLAFQIADDVLDATATAETLGKNPSDEALAKSTYVSLYGLDQAKLRAADQVEIAVDALTHARLRSPSLEALATYIVDRTH